VHVQAGVQPLKAGVFSATGGAVEGVHEAAATAPIAATPRQLTGSGVLQEAAVTPGAGGSGGGHARKLAEDLRRDAMARTRQRSTGQSSARSPWLFPDAMHDAIRDGLEAGNAANGRATASPGGSPGPSLSAATPAAAAAAQQHQPTLALPNTAQREHQSAGEEQPAQRRRLNMEGDYLRAGAGGSNSQPPAVQGPTTQRGPATLPPKQKLNPSAAPFQSPQKGSTLAPVVVPPASEPRGLAGHQAGLTAAGAPRSAQVDKPQQPQRPLQSQSQVGQVVQQQQAPGSPATSVRSPAAAREEQMNTAVTSAGAAPVQSSDLRQVPSAQFLRSAPQAAQNPAAKEPAAAKQQPKAKQLPAEAAAGLPAQQQQQLQVRQQLTAVPFALPPPSLTMSSAELEARARQEYVLIKWQILQEQRRLVGGAVAHKSTATACLLLL
jgi:hypothetical protein